MYRSRMRMTWSPALAGVLFGCTPSAPPSATVSVTALAEAPRAPAAPSASSTPLVESTAAAPDAGAGKYPARWTEKVKLKSLADLAAALGEDVRPNGVSLDLGNYPGSDKRSVRTCVEYGKAIADGFSPETTPEIASESFFKARCTPLSFLHEARPSETSWVSDLRLDKDPLRTLPASMNLALQGLSDEEKDAIAKGQRLTAFDPKLVVTKASPTSVTFEVPKVLTSTVDIVAWGDFDHDGVEDVLFFQSMHSLEGSFRSFRHWIATRKGPKEPLMTVRELGR